MTISELVINQPCEWYGKNLGQHIWVDTVDGWKRCINCKREYLPEPSEALSSYQVHMQDKKRPDIGRIELIDACSEQQAMEIAEASLSQWKAIRAIRYVYV